MVGYEAVPAIPAHQAWFQGMGCGREHIAATFWTMQAYVGKETETTEHGLGERVVLQLTKKFHGNNHQVFYDHFFSTPCLFRGLLEHGLNACETVQQTRPNLPTDLRNLSLAQGEGVFRVMYYFMYHNPLFHVIYSHLLHYQYK